MKYTKYLLAAAAAVVPAAPVLAQDKSAAPADHDAVLTDVILVTGARADPATPEMIMPPSQIALPPDAVAIAARTPGGGAIGNGALSGQLAYRGLFGDRVLGEVNGQRFASGGPNAMDPPMHYAPSVLLERIEIARGVASVADGPSLAGAVDAVLKQVHFGSGPKAEVSGSVVAQFRSVDDSYAVGGLAGLSNERWRVGVLASREKGKDYDFPGGTAGDTAYGRSLYGVHAGLRLGDGELFAEYRRSETDPTGNPQFPMDIVYFNTDFVQGGFRGPVAPDTNIEVRAGHVTVHHLMDNYSLRRPQPAAMQARATFASADTTTASAKVQFGQAQRNVEVGADFEAANRDVRITNPNNAAFYLDAQPGFDSRRFGGFVQLRGGLGGFETEAGVRLDRTSQDAGSPSLGTAVPMGPRSLAAAFAAGPRHAADTTVDAVLRAWLPGESLTPRITLARKTRVPSMLERFSWLPTEASYGLADGNVYVGNRDLRPEVAWIAEAGFDFAGSGVTLRPTVFYRRVDGFIQGTPFDATVGVIDSPVEMVAAMNGDTTPLMFRNVDAELYGVDLDFTAGITPHFKLDGTASYVRAKRRDIADNLYRVAPPNVRIAGTWSQADWSFGAELNAVAKQTHVSVTNGETPSSGYVVMGLFGKVDLGGGLELAGGIENLFDRYYQPHLAGRNRVGDSDVALGERMPGPGRGVWLRIGFGL
jgi:iron complex outermembrane receptor protein